MHAIRCIEISCEDKIGTEHRSTQRWWCLGSTLLPVRQQFQNGLSHTSCFSSLCVHRHSCPSPLGPSIIYVTLDMNHWPWTPQLWRIFLNLRPMEKAKTSKDKICTSIKVFYLNLHIQRTNDFDQI